MASLSTNRNNVSENEATIKYSVSTYTGDSVSYSWNFGSSNQSGSITINIYPEPEGYYDFSAKCTIKVGTKTETTTGEGENQKTEISWDYDYYYESDSIRIYAHPGSFDMEASSSSNSSNNIIANILNEDKINNYWIPHFQAAYRWHNQKDISYSPANITYDYFSNNNNGGMKVKQNDPISAEWFNNCMEGMRQFGKEVDDVEKDELITASLINQMNFSGIN